MGTETSGDVQADGDRCSLDYAATVLAALSGVRHLYGGKDVNEGVIAVLLVLASPGFFAWIASLVLGVDRRLLYLGSVGFTPSQVTRATVFVTRSV
ncbi:hypothetical protein [Haloarcula onubensis]|uniref:TM2 domain-containing protein n=1 Tax=Haloarcula onubensis TaxID=2950539 RepID=A0ABU2FPL5_9EURY|nr:hypothetical protein [Halomicroarcula sp. S3CR25-11]MDS0282708.1 hypothetical protein [Halomicroarcula sp. S3CR25-11]